MDGALALLGGSAAAAAVAVGVGAGAGPGGQGLTQGVLPVLLAQVVPPPDAGADPDARDSDDYDDEDQPAYALFEQRYGNEDYDMEDDFVDDGEEEEVEDDEDGDDEEDEFEKGAERLKQVKSEGASKYRSTPEGEDEEQKLRKKRRIIDSDEDDE